MQDSLPSQTLGKKEDNESSPHFRFYQLLIEYKHLPSKIPRYNPHIPHIPLYLTYLTIILPSSTFLIIL